MDGKDGGEGAGMNKGGKALRAKERWSEGGLERLSKDGGRKGGTAGRQEERKEGRTADGKGRMER